jgi:hypothetical protein
MEKYVDPQNVMDPNAESLTAKETDIQMADSFRTGRQFIKSAIDPVLPTLPNQYLLLINTLDKETGGKYTSVFNQLREHFKRDRPVEAICWHIFKDPIKFLDKNGKEQFQYGWAKLRGEFATYGEMETEVRAIMQDHDTYTRTYAYPKGVFFPISTADFSSEEVANTAYDKDIANSNDMRQKIIEMERKREDALIKMQEDTEPGSLEDYIRQKLRCCVAELRVQRAKLDIEKFQPILGNQTNIVAKMEKDHSNYFSEGLTLYQKKMEEIGFPVPTTFYEGCLSTGMQ